MTRTPSPADLRHMVQAALDGARTRVAGSVRGLFADAPDPLAGTLEFPGDPGLFGPGSMSWEVVSDVSAFAGGIRALLVQAAHPEVAAGVAQHSSYRQDPLGRLARTGAYVTATTFGAMPEVEAAIARVGTAHRGVAGRSHRGVSYAASAPELLSWVHNSLVEGFLVAYHHFRRPLSSVEANRFVSEQTRLGRLLGASELPTTASELAEYLATHPGTAPSPGGAEAARFLASPPLPLLHRAPYQLLHAGAVATIDPRLRGLLGLTARPGALLAARATLASLRAALGERGPSYLAALERVGAAPDPAVL